MNDGSAIDSAPPVGDAQPGVRDEPSVAPDGTSLESLPEGASFRRLPTHADERGSLTELFDLRWGWRDAPIPSVTAVTIRPGRVKGWALHREMEDRFALFHGDVLVVFYDVRDGSPTCGMVSKLVLTDHERGLINVPPGVWHALHNIGDRDALLINFPTVPYRYEEPDKRRLPLINDVIPYRFENCVGG